MRTQLLRLCRLIGAQLTELGRYPGWSPVYDTELQRSYISAFLAVNPEYLAPEVKPIHAGLECGVIAGRSETECRQAYRVLSIGPGYLRYPYSVRADGYRLVRARICRDCKGAVNALTTRFALPLLRVNI